MSDAVKAEAQLAQIALEFLRRTELKGGEIEAFVNVHNWLLHKVAQGTSVFENEIKLGDENGKE